MLVIDHSYVDSHKEEILEAMRSGKIFIYPTDTIYGLGCNALLEESVAKLREIKQREQKPFSIIGPSKEWILKYCDVSEEDIDTYLPGPYTLFLKVREEVLAPSTHPGLETLGVRIPKHWFVDFVTEAGVPFVTTSVNISGEKYAEKIEDLPAEIAERVDYCIYEGEKVGEPSIKVDLHSRV